MSPIHCPAELRQHILAVEIGLRLAFDGIEGGVVRAMEKLEYNAPRVVPTEEADMALVRVEEMLSAPSLLWFMVIRHAAQHAGKN
jgi:hypothetical protein